MSQWAQGIWGLPRECAASVAARPTYWVYASRPRFPFRFLQQPRQTVVLSIQYDSCALPEASCIDTWAPSCENMEPPVRTFHYIESFASTSHCFDAPSAV